MSKGIKLYVVFPCKNHGSYPSNCGARVYDTIGKAKAAKKKYGDETTKIVTLQPCLEWQCGWYADEIPSP